MTLKIHEKVAELFASKIWYIIKLFDYVFKREGYLSE